MSRNKIPDRIQLQVRERANYLCEYCHANERWQYVRFTVDHVLPVSLGGNDNSESATKVTASDAKSAEAVLRFPTRVGVACLRHRRVLQHQQRF